MTRAEQAWYVERPYNETGVYVTDKSTSALVAKVYEPDSETYEGDKLVTIDTRAAILASAPALLAALERIAAETCDHGAGFCARDAARAAIAQARGGGR